MLIVTTAVAARVTAIVTLADVAHQFQAALIRHHSLLSPSFPERVEDGAADAVPGLGLELGTKLWRSSAKATAGESVNTLEAMAMETLKLLMVRLLDAEEFRVS